MASFKDSAGKIWDVNLTVAKALRVKDRTGLDLLNDPKALEKFGDAFAAYGVLKAVLDVDDSLGEALDEAGLEAAITALVEALLDFFPPPKAAPFRRAWERAGATLAKRREAALAEMATRAETFDVEAALDGRLTAGATSGNGPASAESTPAP
jgi:hypothetical protein